MEQKEKVTQYLSPHGFTNPRSYHSVHAPVKSKTSSNKTKQNKQISMVSIWEYPLQKGPFSNSHLSLRSEGGLIHVSTLWITTCSIHAVGTALRWPGQRVPRYTAVRPCWRRRKRWSSRGWSWFWYWKKASWTWPNGTLAFWMFCLYVFFFFYSFFGGAGWIFTIFAGQPHPPKKDGKTNCWCKALYDNMLCMMKENTQTGGCWLGFWKGLGWW